ncbi:MAG: TlpA family protein disulfide reductase [Eubacterium sp.]|nr:TlpA family protein disulfide reductase [Eubacterium sp.]
MRGKLLKASVFCLLVTMLFMLTACSDGGEQKVETATEEGTDEMPVTETARMPGFKSVDLNGNEVDESIFAEADITVINFWGTFCGPCINEMPELAEWDKNLPEGVQIIGIVVDVADTDAPEYETAKRLVEETGVEYTNIIAGDQFDSIMENLVGVPTTFFVDSEGKCLCDEVIGADVQAYKDTVENLK